ncbi:hypothetical protein GCM10020221_17060 [Streptomyces thioluteus]|uniref:Lipoprotein n=1 Tax=Streptomyces thioluteus TaxID=66431 RepID=A0ABN3WNU2_STRTU
MVALAAKWMSPAETEAGFGAGLLVPAVAACGAARPKTVSAAATAATRNDFLDMVKQSPVDQCMSVIGAYRRRA